jgi:tether containing UBX domain for GLUT4
VSDPAVRALSLLELGLAPSSMLLVKFVDEDVNRACARAGAVAAAAATDWHADIPAAELLAPGVLAQAQDLPPPPTFDNTPPAAPSTSGRTLGGGGGSGSSTGSSGPQKIPKWLKIGSACCPADMLAALADDNVPTEK